jgi:hypothetical protein
VQEYRAMGRKGQEINRKNNDNLMVSSIYPGPWRSAVLAECAQALNGDSFIAPAHFIMFPIRKDEFFVDKKETESQILHESPLFEARFFRRADVNNIRVPKKSLFAGCSKMPRCKAPEILRSEAYIKVRRNDEG